MDGMISFVRFVSKVSCTCCNTNFLPKSREMLAPSSPIGASQQLLSSPTGLATPFNTFSGTLSPVYPEAVTFADRAKSIGSSLWKPGI